MNKKKQRGLNQGMKHYTYKRIYRLYWMALKHGHLVWAQSLHDMAHKVAS